MWSLVCTLGYVLADQAELFLGNHAIMVGVKLKYQFINCQREHKRINTRMKKKVTRFRLTLLLGPPHLLADLGQVVLRNYSTLVNVKKFENLSIDVVPGELTDVAFFLCRTARIKVRPRVVSTALGNGILTRDKLLVFFLLLLFLLLVFLAKLDLACVLIIIHLLVIFLRVGLADKFTHHVLLFSIRRVLALFTTLRRLFPLGMSLLKLLS